MPYDPHKRKGAYVFREEYRPYQMCAQCIMDTSDPEIAFDDNGVCSHCHDYDQRVANEVFRGSLGKQRLAAEIAKIKEDGKGKRYNCILGLSGGVDSTYTAYITKKLGLRPLAVHLDNGWNSEIAVRNIENIVRTLGLDLYTKVLDWDEFRHLQLAFLRASTPDSEIPTDHAIVATLYEAATKHGVRWIMDGSNVVTEIMVPATWSHGHSDWGYIRNLNSCFGGKPLRTYPHYTYYDLLIKYRAIKKIQRFPILNYIDYNKIEAMEILQRELGWVSYGGKHYESIYTRFYQGYILPEKFGFDKRRSHLSCLIRNGRISREEALIAIQQPAIPKEQLIEDKAFVIKKLGLSEEEFTAIMKAPRKTFWDYPSDERDIAETRAYKLLWRCYGLYKKANAQFTVLQRSMDAAALGIAKLAVRELGSNLRRSPRVVLLAVGSGVVRGILRIVKRVRKIDMLKVGSGVVRGILRIGLAVINPAVPSLVAFAKKHLPESGYERARELARRLYRFVWRPL